MKNDTAMLIEGLRSMSAACEASGGALSEFINAAADRLEELTPKHHKKVYELLEKGYEIEESATVIRKPGDNHNRGIVTEFGKVQWFDR